LTAEELIPLLRAITRETQADQARCGYGDDIAAVATLVAADEADESP